MIYQEDISIDLNIVIMENKWKLIDLDEYFKINPDASVRWYQMAIKLYLFFKGKLSDCDFKTFKDREFKSALFREFPYALKILTDDRVLRDPNNPDYQEITEKMKWRAIYHDLAKPHLRRLYEQFEQPKPKQLTLF